MKTFWNELVETWKVIWKSIVTSWYTKEPMMGWLPRKLGMICVGVLLFGVVYYFAALLFFFNTLLHRVLNELLGQYAILWILLLVYPAFRPDTKPPLVKRHWVILCVSILCLLVGVGTRLVNVWADATVIAPVLGLFLVPGMALFVLWVHGKSRRL